jgi:hypothetical protein
MSKEFTTDKEVLLAAADCIEKFRNSVFKHCFTVKYLRALAAHGPEHTCYFCHFNYGKENAAICKQFMPADPLQPCKGFKTREMKEDHFDN